MTVVSAPGEDTGDVQPPRQELARQAFQFGRQPQRMNPRYLLEALSLEDLAVAARRDQLPQGLQCRDALWERLKPRIEATIRQKFANLAAKARLEHADLLGESFLVFEEALIHYDGTRRVPFWSYFLTGLVHHFIDIAKRNSRIQTVGEEEILDTIPVSTPSAIPGQNLLQLMGREQIEALFPETIRDRDLKLIIFWLYHMEDMKIPMLAKRFGKSTGTIHNWLEEVRKHLQQKVQG